jgi:HlyD family secretion protein
MNQLPAMVKKYSWALAVIALTVVIAATVLFYRRRGGEQVHVQNAEVTSGPVVRRALVSGTLEPARMVEVGSQVSGTIASIDVDYNSTVKAGQVLARLDPASFQTQLTQAEAGLAKARADRAQRAAVFGDARRKLEASETLSSDRQLAQAELDATRTTMLQAEADVRAADADIAAAQAAITEARVSLEHTVIRSPIDGIVIGRHVDVGQTLAARVNAPVLFTLGDLRHMRILADVPEGDVGGVQPGSQVRFSIETLGDGSRQRPVAEVRLDPQVVQATATSGSTAATPVPAATSGTSTVPATGSTPTSGANQAATGSNTNASATSSNVASTTTVSGASSRTPAVGVVSYIAVIDVDAVNESIPPGGTAIVTLTAGRRPQAVRIPNNALAFSPSNEAFAAAHQQRPELDRSDDPTLKGKKTQRGYVWKYENNQFVPIPVEVGIADDTWSELISGDVRPGDHLITAATVPQR